MKTAYLTGALLATVVFAPCNPASAGIFRWTDTEGRVHISDQPPPNQASESVELKINTYTSVSYETLDFDVGKKVLMYSTRWCGYCKKARAYFRSNNIAFTDYDIDKDSNARRRYEKMGARGVPVIIVGNRRMNGFSASEFRSIYD